MNWDESSLGLLTALSIGFLIGTVRERLHRPGAMKAGVRTHAIVALNFGDSGAFATSVIVGLVEIHAAAVGISQLSHSDLA